MVSSLARSILTLAAGVAVAVGSEVSLGCDDASVSDTAHCTAGAAAAVSTSMIQQNGLAGKTIATSGERPCQSCDTCVEGSNPSKQSGFDCGQCANDGHKWWPCNHAFLCACGGTTAASPTLAPTPAPTAATPAPTAATPAPTAATPAPTAATPPATPAPTSAAGATCAAIPGNPQGVSDAQCAVCAGGYGYWPCKTEGLCGCSGGGGGSANTPMPTQAPPMPTQAPASLPTPSPESSGAGCVAIPDNSLGQSVSDAHCAACATGSTVWPCNPVGVLCRCSGMPTQTPSPAPTPFPPGSSVDVCSATGPSCDFPEGAGISSWFTEDLFQQIFPKVCSPLCYGCTMLTYKCMIKATLGYPEFAQSDNHENNQREVAAWLAEMSQETTGGGCPQSIENADGTCSCGSAWCDSEPGGGCAAWGLCFVEEAGGTYCSAWDPNYPCVTGKEYKGRGPKQLSWNYNYGQFSKEFCHDKNILLNNPEWVASNPTLAWSSSIWFWFTGGACNPEVGETCKPNCHDVFLGINDPICPGDAQANRKHGLGWVTNIINGGLECGAAGAGKCDRRVHSRARFYKHFCSILTVNPLAPGWTEDENLYCASQSNYVQAPNTCAFGGVSN